MKCYLASYSGLGGIPLPNIGSMGGGYGPLRRRHSGKRPCCSGAVRRSQPFIRCDHNLDDLKDRLYRSFGVEVRPDLQVRAGIIIQPEEGRWVFTPDELRDLAHGLESILLNSSPGAGWPFRLTLKQYIGLFSPLFT